MSLAEKLFGFQGRLRRRDWWIFFLVLIVLDMFLAALGMAVMGGSLTPFTSGAKEDDFDLGGWLAQRALVQMVVTLITLWPALALGVKRIHDRDRSGWWFAAFCLLTVVQQIVTWLRYRIGPGYHPSGPLTTLVGLTNLVFAIWMLVELFFLDGTAGGNRFGPSPKEAVDG
jgi:uncharacterized membrane protein YhaH (DUF805 family)